MKTRRILAFVLIMVVLVAALPQGFTALADRTPSVWAAPEMTAANTSGLLTPSAARDFHSALTRDEFCELVVVMVEQTLGRALPVPATNPFTADTDPISIHALKAWNYGIITGITTTLFAPAQKVERQQLCAMMIRAIRGLERDLNRTLLSPGITTLPYKDAAQIRDYAIEPVQLAYTNVIMQGNEQGQFMPANDITSQECVAVIIRSFNRIENARTPGMTTDQLLDAAAARVHIGYAYGDTAHGVTQNLTLPTTSTGGATVSWTSSNNNVISIRGATGTVNVGNYPQTVTLTATIRIGNYTRTKTYTLTTSQNTGDRLLLENALDELDILYINDGDGDGIVTGRIGLPTTVLGLSVTWYSNNPSVVSNAGIVNVPSGSETRTATLTATIRLGSQTRTKNFNLSVVNPAYGRGVTLHGVQFGMAQSQVAQLLGTAKRSISAGSNETWYLYYSTNYANFIAVAFISDRAAAVYSMAPGAANQLRNRSGSVITVAEADSIGGVGALSFIDPGNASQQYAILIYDSTTSIGASRSLLTDGQEQMLFELVNAFRQRNNRAALEWSAKLGTAARTHSNNSGSGNLQQRVTSTGFDSARYAGGNIIPGNSDAIDALNQIVSNSSGSSSMRTAILQSSATVFGSGFYASNSGTYRTYFTYALGAVTAITGVSVRQNNANVSTINVSTGATNASTVTLTMSPSGYNESVSIASSNTNIATVSGWSATSSGGTVVVTGVSNGSAYITVTGNCSGRSYNIPVDVGIVYATNLTASNVYMEAGKTYQLTATTTPAQGPAVTWAHINGGTYAPNASGISVSSSGRVTVASSISGTIRVRATVASSSSRTLTQDITIYVDSISLNPNTDVNFTVGDMSAKLVTASTGYATNIDWAANPASGVVSLSRDTNASSSNHSSRCTVTPQAVTQTREAVITVTASMNGTTGTISRTFKAIVQSSNVPCTSITVTGAGNASAITTSGGSLQMSAAVLPANATNKAVIWTVSPTGIATINSSTGLLTAVSNGQVTVTATAADGSGVKGEKVISISGQPIKVTGVTINSGGAATIAPGGTLQLSVTVQPSNATVKDVVWTVSAASIYTHVDQTGFLTVGPDETDGASVRVTATASDGSGVKGEFAITVKVPVTGILVTSAGNVTSVSPGSQIQMSARALPMSAPPYIDVVWSVSAASAFTHIDLDGMLTVGLDEPSGTNIIVTATASNNHSIIGEFSISIVV